MPKLRWLLVLLIFYACSPSKQIAKSAKKDVINDPALQAAHVGISIFDPATGKYLYDFQGDKFFVPASNIKIPTCYVAMKYLGDSLVAARIGEDYINNEPLIEVHPSGDPTFLHPEFKFQPLYELLKNQKKVQVNFTAWRDKPWGSGWSWSDYGEAYMAERSALPVFGNVFRIFLSGDTIKSIPKLPLIASLTHDRKLGYDLESRTVRTKNFRIYRALDKNLFFIQSTSGAFGSAVIPINTNIQDIEKFLEDTLNVQNVFPASSVEGYVDRSDKKILYSQPTDSVLKPMMHRSDNFFAEQMLLMVSNQLLGVMNVQQVVDSILKTDFSDLPQKPRWADGSGLSRYNLFTPQDMVSILNKMQKEFGMERIKEIFPTGNEGTLRNYYVPAEGLLYAKTGTLSGVVAISGYLVTDKGRPLIFSVLVNNHRASATDVRRAVERFIQGIRKAY
ncbi:MAG: D-alanyl-D-alanine carboxypeptidase/D-alanyl-D-alanine endopeptidase [Flavisolibacter sp.]